MQIGLLFLCFSACSALIYDMDTFCEKTVIITNVCKHIINENGCKPWLKNDCQIFFETSQLLQFECTVYYNCQPPLEPMPASIATTVTQNTETTSRLKTCQSKYENKLTLLKVKSDQLLNGCKSKTASFKSSFVKCKTTLESNQEECTSSLHNYQIEVQKIRAQLSDCIQVKHVGKVWSNFSNCLQPINETLSFQDFLAQNSFKKYVLIVGIILCWLFSLIVTSAVTVYCQRRFTRRDVYHMEMSDFITADAGTNTDASYNVLHVVTCPENK